MPRLFTEQTTVGVKSFLRAELLRTKGYRISAVKKRSKNGFMPVSFELILGRSPILERAILLEM